MTLWPKRAEPLRIEYFLSQLFASQDIRGGEFPRLKRSYQVSILGDNLYKDSHAVHRFEYYDQERGMSLGGRAAVITLELRKLEELVEKPLEETSGQERAALRSSPAYRGFYLAYAVPHFPRQPAHRFAGIIGRGFVSEVRGGTGTVKQWTALQLCGTPGLTTTNLMWITKKPLRVWNK
jgi:hypothetical protein